MKTYVGSKIIRADKMSKFEFEVKHHKRVDGKPDTGTVPENQPGYHVAYPNPGGMYHSWSPKDVFENAYRELTEGEVEMAMNHPIQEDGGDYGKEN